MFANSTKLKLYHLNNSSNTSIICDKHLFFISNGREVFFQEHGEGRCGLICELYLPKIKKSTFISNACDEVVEIDGISLINFFHVIIDDISGGIEALDKIV
jgi:hypothetical protein